MQGTGRTDGYRLQGLGLGCNCKEAISTLQSRDLGLTVGFQAVRQEGMPEGLEGL